MFHFLPLKILFFPVLSEVLFHIISFLFFDGLMPLHVPCFPIQCLLLDHRIYYYYFFIFWCFFIFFIPTRNLHMLCGLHSIFFLLSLQLLFFHHLFYAMLFHIILLYYSMLHHCFYANNLSLRFEISFFSFGILNENYEWLPILV